MTDHNESFVDTFKITNMISIHQAALYIIISLKNGCTNYKKNTKG